MEIPTNLFLLAVISYSSFSTVYAIDCIQCINCEYPLPKATPCDPSLEATHCRKHVHMSYQRNGSGVRLCGQAPDDGQDQTCAKDGVAKGICVFYCNTDGCNAAPAVYNMTLLWTMIVGSLLLLLTIMN